MESSEKSTNINEIKLYWHQKKTLLYENIWTKFNLLSAFEF